MADPKLKRTRVTVAYSADDGVSVESRFVGGPRNPACTDPLEGLRDAHRETARLMALFGRPDLAMAATADSIQSVADWRAAAQKSGS